MSKVVAGTVCGSANQCVWMRCFPSSRATERNLARAVWATKNRGGLDKNIVHASPPTEHYKRTNNTIEGLAQKGKRKE